MATVRAGVPVFGGNLPRSQMKQAMHDVALEQALPAAALATQQERIREGHCHMLPEDRVAPMTRVQIARDRSLAEIALQQRQPGRTVLVIAGNGHVERGLGVPAHLPVGLRTAVISMRAGASPGDPSSVDRVWETPPTPQRDYCGQLQMQPAAGS